MDKTTSIVMVLNSKLYCRLYYFSFSGLFVNMHFYCHYFIMYRSWGFCLNDKNNIMIYIIVILSGGIDSKQQELSLLCKDHFIFLCIRLFKVYLKHLGICKCIKIIINALVTIVDILSIYIGTNAFISTSSVNALGLTLEYSIFILILCLIMSIVLKYVFELLVFFEILIFYSYTML